jgi:DNA polymerase III subunit delta'
MAFDSFVGNRKTVERLRRKLREGRFPHALIFSGPEGIGKRTCALMIAKALNCLRAVADDFCDECSSCRKINSGAHPDVITMSVEEEASQIKIGQVRRLLEMLEFQPLEGRNKVFIIDPAGLMNPEAANALLKGLEEPPANTFFVLISVNVHELLLTIRSRSQVYNFVPLTPEEIRRQTGAEELVVRWSQGSIGRTQNLDVAALKSEREIMLQFLETALTAGEEQFQELLGMSAELGRARHDFEGRMAVLSVILSDLLYIAEGTAERVVNIDIQDRLTRLAESAGTGRVVRMSEFLRVIESSLKSNVNRQMLADVLALTAVKTADYTDYAE